MTPPTVVPNAAGSGAARQEGMTVGVTLLARLALIYTLFAVANTMIMSFRSRTGEFRLLRTLGAGRAQVLRMVRWEGAVVAVTGVALGAAAIALTAGCGRCCAPPGWPCRWRCRGANW